MQKLGILASILLLGAALVGPIGFSFAQSADTNSTETTQAPATTQSSPPPKPLSDEEKIRIKIAEEKAKLAKRYDEKVTALKKGL
jgi:hypothetical protein